LHLRLLDGREIGVPLEWFPKLRDATASQRNNWRLFGRGIGIQWEELDEDLSVSGLLMWKLLSSGNLAFRGRLPELRGRINQQKGSGACA
jgi:hypothetical protein